jgi:hypothetical protein
MAQRPHHRPLECNRWGSGQCANDGHAVNTIAQSEAQGNPLAPIVFWLSSDEMTRGDGAMRRGVE